MRKISDIVITIFLLIILAYVCIYNKKIITYFVHLYNTYNMVETSNEYTKHKDFKAFKRTDDFTPTNKEELTNILYTILDDGMTRFVFYCEYDCSDDIKEISDTKLEIMNNYVHPYNSYDKFNITVDSYNVVTILITKNYNDDDIHKINTKLNQIIKQQINPNDDIYDQIKAFHDYVVNTTEYDKSDINSIETIRKMKTHKADNVLLKGTGICGGYTDTLAIFLNAIGLDNFKTSTDSHIWNTLYLDNTWYHIDITWDDPVTESGEDLLIHDYFMITSEKLLNLDTEKHSYDKTKFLELS